MEEGVSTQVLKVWEFAIIGPRTDYRDPSVDVRLQLQISPTKRCLTTSSSPQVRKSGNSIGPPSLPSYGKARDCERDIEVLGAQRQRPKEKRKKRIACRRRGLEGLERRPMPKQVRKGEPDSCDARE